ncbi:MAG: PotD/PotF family extracellular solute-binding protein [Aestuariivirga sp.]|uniref:ABC transporter substrate-binding protein n=1 Tax=Aestuariivirga sp. TaxID=2650926 RepID=UPI0038D14867
MRLSINRRTALWLLGALPLLGAASRPGHAAGEIKVLNWQGYGTDEKWALEAFEKATGIKVVHDYFNSEQEMLTKLRTSPGAYDVVLINNIYVMDAAKEGLIQPLDTAKLSNFGDLAPALRDSDRFVKDGKHFASAWVWGLTSFAYNDEKITDKIDSIEAMWDPKFAGKVGMRDDAMEAIQFAALATGQDINNPADMAKIKDKLAALKPQLKTFWSSEDEWNKLFAAGDYLVAVYWSGSASRSRKAMKLPVRFVVPKEGAIGWFDGLAVAANAPNPDGAHAFINFMIDPSFYVPWDTNVGAPASANLKAMAGLPEDALNRAVLGDPEVVKRVQWMAPVTDQQRQAQQELWDEVKTSFAQ